MTSVKLVGKDDVTEEGLLKMTSVKMAGDDEVGEIGW